MAKQAPIKWAQRDDLVLMTVDLSDITDAEINLDEKKFTFKAKGGSNGEEHHAEVEFYGEVVPAESKRRITAHDAFFTIKKKEDGYWPRLTKDKTKYHWLKVDFDKWKDEDDEEEEAGNDQDTMAGMENFDMSSLMSSMGGAGAGGMDFSSLAGLGGATGAPTDTGAEPAQEEEDSDDDDMPDLE